MALTQSQKDDLTAEITFMQQRAAQFTAQAKALQVQIDRINAQIATANTNAANTNAAIVNMQALIATG